MIFIIHSLNMLDRAIEFEKRLGKKCYIPGRDTKQDQHGDQILFDNLKAMRNCESDVYCFWDGESFGAMFDMGMAYALGYKILPCLLFDKDEKHWRRYFKEKINKDESIEYNFKSTIEESDGD